MKKILAIIIALCVIIAGVLAFLYLRSNGSGTAAPEASAAAEQELNENGQETALEEMPAIKEIDKEAIYKLHDPKEIVATVDGRDITWAEYFGWLNNVLIQIQNYMSQMSYYGTTTSWEDSVGSGGDSFAVSATKQTDNQLKYFAAIEKLAETNKVALSEDNKKEIAEQLKADINSLAGEGASEEDFNKYLSTMYLPRDAYDRLIGDNVLMEQCLKTMYGENGSKLSDKDTISWLESKEYMSANHILFMTMDKTNNQPLDDTAKSEKKAQAEKAAKELQAIQKDEDRLKKFLSMKQELDEDSGKVAYPEGYTFTPNTMVAEFEKAAKELKPYEVSAPVETTYGYHVLMGLPLNPEAALEIGADGTAVTARAKYAGEKFGEDFAKVYEQIKLNFADGFTAPSILDYIK